MWIFLFIRNKLVEILSLLSKWTMVLLKIVLFSIFIMIVIISVIGLVTGLVIGIGYLVFNGIELISSDLSKSIFDFVTSNSKNNINDVYFRLGTSFIGISTGLFLIITSICKSSYSINFGFIDWIKDNIRLAKNGEKVKFKWR